MRPFVISLFILFASIISPLRMLADETSLRIVMSTAPGTLDPHYNITSQDNIIGGLLFGALYEFDQNGQIVPLFAETLVEDEEKGDFILTLKPDIFWSDGEAFTSADVVYSVARYARLAKSRDIDNRSKFNFIHGFDDYVAGNAPFDAIDFHAVDDLTIRFRSDSEPDTMMFFMSDMNWGIVPKHAIERFGDKAWTKPENIVTSGAFLLSETIETYRMKLKKNPKFFFKDEVKLEEIEIYFANEAKSAMRIAQEKSAKIVIRPDAEVLRFAETLYPDRIQHYGGDNVESLNFNMNSEKLADIRVRKALALAMDIDRAVERAGYYSVRQTALAPFLRDHLDPAFYEPLNVRKSTARTLLAEAGYNPDNPLVLTLGSYEVQNKRSYVQSLVEDWIDIGVYIKPHMHDRFKDLIEDDQANPIDLDVLGWGGWEGDPSYYLVQVQENGASMLHLHRPDLEERIAKALAPGDLAFKMEETDTILRELTQEFYIIPLLTYGTVDIVAPEVKNYNGKYGSIWRIEIEDNAANDEN